MRRQDGEPGALRPAAGPEIEAAPAAVLRPWQRLPVALVAALGIGVLCGVTGCASETPPPIPTVPQVAGTWVPEAGGGTGTVVLSADGTGRARRLWNGRTLLTGSLTWHRGDRSPTTADGFPIITLDFSPDAGVPVTKQILTVHRQDDSLTLQIAAPDPDDPPIVLQR